MAVDSVGVTALYIHGDLCFPAVSPELLRVSGSAPGLRFPAFLFMRGDPLCISSRFVDLVGVTVLYRQMVVDSVGVTTLYIHGDLLLSVRIPQGRPEAKASGYQPLRCSGIRRAKETQGRPKATSLGLPALAYLEAVSPEPFCGFQVRIASPPRSAIRALLLFYAAGGTTLRVYLVQVGWVARFLLTGWGGGKEGGKWKDRLGDPHPCEAVMDGAPGVGGRQISRSALKRFTPALPPKRASSPGARFFGRTVASFHPSQQVGRGPRLAGVAFRLG